jgi:hypothetical protein
VSLLSFNLIFVGFSLGGIQIQNFESTGLLPFGSKSNVNLVHNASVYFTAMATNAVGKTAVSYSDRILVDLTPPLITEVNDGRGSFQIIWRYLVIS